MANLKKTFVKQQDQTDCGVACLLSVIQYYKGSSSLEKLRELSGTALSGTTLLGLYQCANKVGFTAEAFEADMPNLKALQEPCILHVLVNNNLQHYVVCYGIKGQKLIIGDPAQGIVELSEDELLAIWQSRALLQLKPTSAFQLKKHIGQSKKKWFWQLIKEDINILTVTMVLGILATILGLATAIFSQKLIDKVLPSGNKQMLITSLLLLFVILLIKTAVSFIRQHFLLMQSKDFNNRIVSSFFGALMYLPKSFFDTRRTGDMVARMNDTSRIQKNIGYITGTVFIDIITFLSSSFFLFNYSRAISLIVFGFVPLLAWVVLSYTRSVKQHQENAMVAGAQNESSYIDTINGITMVKSYNKEQLFASRVNQTYNHLQNQYFALGKLGNRLVGITDTMSVILSMVLITVASFMVLNQQLKIGEMMAVLSLTASLIPAVARLSQINLQLQEVGVAFDRMYDFTSIKPEFERDDKTEHIVFETLKVEQIVLRFPGRRSILHNINFKINKGEIVALLGESGCGKSTLMAILEKFYKPEKGAILVNETPFENINAMSWRNIIASVSQEIKLINGNLIENIALNNSNEEVLNVVTFCNAMGFHQYFEGFPQGYFTLLGEEGINISGGQKQLVALARALYTKPQVLLLDEATAAMDRNTEKFILNMLCSIKHKMAIVFITHKAQTAKIADRIYIIEDGKTTHEDTPENLANADNFFSRLIADVAMPY